MLEKFTQRLIAEDIKRENNALLMESIVFNQDVSNMNRLTFVKEREADSQTVQNFTEKLSSVTVDQNQPVEEQVKQVLEACKEGTENNSEEAII
jgi:hypothetical protein